MTFLGGKARTVAFAVHVDERGRLVAFDFAQVPFRAERAFLIDGVPTGVARGGHAHLREEQLLVALAGEVLVELRAGGEEAQARLRDNGDGLLVRPGVWFRQTYSGPEAKLLVLASGPYDPSGYVRE